MKERFEEPDVEFIKTILEEEPHVKWGRPKARITIVNTERDTEAEPDVGRESSVAGPDFDHGFDYEGVLRSITGDSEATGRGDEDPPGGD